MPLSDDVQWFEPEQGKEMLDWLSQYCESMRIVCAWPSDPELKVVVVVEEFVQDKLTYRFGVVNSAQAADALASHRGLRYLWFTIRDSLLSRIWD